MKDEDIVKALNLLIEEAVCDGGDAGGAYHQNQHDLVESINIVLDTLGLQNKYEVAKHTGYAYWSNYYIERKMEKEVSKWRE